MDTPEFALIILGVTGNLAKIKLIPALYDLASRNLLPSKATIIGVGRRPLTDEEFGNYFRDTLKNKSRHHAHPIDEKIYVQLAEKLSYFQGNFEDPKFYSSLKNMLDGRTARGAACENRIYYLATYPSLYENIFKNLKASGLIDEDCGWIRLMIEKPIGVDLSSAKALNKLLLSYFKEDQIYRLDHYLGKETMQNILTFRFGNGIFEPLINKQHVDHIQVTAAEDFGIGMRGGYYDSVGAMRDVGQNHILQMIALALMDAPKSFGNAAITRERIKAIKSLQPDTKSAVFGQYEGYTQEENVNPKSKTDTFFAFKTFLESSRFAGVPIYVRAGKKLQSTVTEVSIVFKNHPVRLYKDFTVGIRPNILIYRIQPNEGIVLKILAKTPAQILSLEDTYMQFCYHQLSSTLPDPYEKLIADAISGDQTFFNDAPEIEAQWEFIDPLVAAAGKPKSYKAGSWGPKEANDLIKKDGREWLEPSVAFCNF